MSRVPFLPTVYPGFHSIKLYHMDTMQPAKRVRLIADPGRVGVTTEKVRKRGAARFDLTAEGQIDFDDFFAFAEAFGQSVAGKRVNTNSSKKIRFPTPDSRRGSA